MGEEDDKTESLHGHPSGTFFIYPYKRDDGDELESEEYRFK